jgi:hypothetical protein
MILLSADLLQLTSPELSFYFPEEGKIKCFLLIDVGLPMPIWIPAY